MGTIVYVCAWIAGVPMELCLRTLDMDFTTTSIPPAIQVKDIACYPTSIIRAAFSAKARSRSLTQLIHTAYIQVSWVSLPVPKDLKQFLFRFRKHRLFGQITQHHNCLLYLFDISKTARAVHDMLLELNPLLWQQSLLEIIGNKFYDFLAA